MIMIQCIKSECVNAIVGFRLLSVAKSADDDGLFLYIGSRKLQETMGKSGSYQCITYED